MTKIKIYTKNNKLLLIKFVLILCFFLVYNTSYCFAFGEFIIAVCTFAPHVFYKIWQISPYLIYTTGSLTLTGLGILGGIKATEIGYNWKYFLVNYIENNLKDRYLIIKAYLYCFGSAKNTVKYYPLLNNILTDLGLMEKKTPKIVYLDRIITERVIKYETSKQLEELHSTIMHLKNSVNEFSICEKTKKSSSEIIEEILGLTKYEETVCWTIDELQKNFDFYNIPLATKESGAAGRKAQIHKILFFLDQPKVRFHFDNKNINYADMSLAKFFIEFPTIYLAVESLKNNFNDLSNQIIELIPSYETKGTFMFSYFKLKPDACFLYLNNNKKNPINLSDYIFKNLDTIITENQTKLNQIIDHLDRILTPKQNLLKNNEDFNFSSMFGAPLAVSVLGFTASVSKLPSDQLIEIINHVLYMIEFAPMLKKPEIVHCLIKMYEHNGFHVPDILQEHNKIKIINFLNTPIPTKIDVVSYNLINYDDLLLYAKYTGAAIIALGILGTGIWYLKNTGDTALIQNSPTFRLLPPPKQT